MKERTANMKADYKNWMPKGMVHDIFSKMKYGDMEAFVDRLCGQGYEKVELIDTTKGMFMSPFEATWMTLSGSALLVGIK